MSTIIEFNNKNNVYNQVKNKINNIDDDTEIVNCIRIKYRNDILLTGHMTSPIINNKKAGQILEDYFIKIYYENNVIEYPIYNIVHLLEENIEDNIEDNKLYFDSHLNLFFIKFNCIFYENIYYDLNNLDKKALWQNNNINNDIIIKWLDHTLTNDSYITKISSDYIWINKYLLLPPIPYLISDDNLNDYEEDLISGSVVLDINNNIIGLISHVTDKIYITPILSILRSLEYFDNNKICLLNIDTLRVNINIMCDNINYNKQYLYINNNDNFKYYKSLNKKIINSNLSPDIYSNLSTDINNNINKKKKTQYLNLRSGTIIESIDDYTLSNNSTINNNDIIVDNKEIPIKSYIWLFKKNIDTNIDIDNIENKIKINIFKKDSFKINKEAFESGMIYRIDETNINKKIKINEFYYYFEDNYNGINLSNINLINYRNKYILEVDEHLILLLKDTLRDNNYNICNYIWNNKYNKMKKILLLLSINNNKNVIKIIKKYNNLEEITLINNSKRKLKKIINNFYK